jgi:acyl-homoserine-lactone acylase
VRRLGAKRAAGLALVAVVAAVATISASTAGASAPSRPTVVIRWTSYGIPHIEATTYEGAGEGYGYAFAQDDICTMANDYLTVTAQRSKWFGPDGTYQQRGNSVTVSNLDSDFFFQRIIDSGIVPKLLARKPPYGPLPGVRELVAGYVQGYNRYLASVGGSKGIPDARCRGRKWVRPINQMDVWMRFYQLIELASGDVAISGTTEAKPPAGLTSDAPALSPAQTAKLLARRLPEGGIGAIGSNAVAIGSAGTRNHRGLLLGNPHFPWIGTERFYQTQIDIPGKMDVEGSSLYGVPIVLIGHTATMAWSHTVSTAYRFTPIELTLVPGLPTTYLYDGKLVKMTSQVVTVEVRQPNGSLEPESRTLYASQFGPIFNSLEGIPLPWTPATAFAFEDANATNFRAFNTFFEFDHAGTAAQMLQILQSTEGIPWVNTIVADKWGHALYADIGSIPDVSDAEAAKCDTALGAATFVLLSLPILDGTRSACNWQTGPGAVAPGLFGPSQMPHLFRSDYVTNSNNSYWLTNPHHPLTGFAQIIGNVDSARTLRTRIGLIMTQERIDGTDGLGPPGFTVKAMENMDLSDISYSGELTRNSLVSLCRSYPGGLAPTTSGAPVAVGDACDILADWNLREDLGSKGAVLFDRFWNYADTYLEGVEVTPFVVPFNVHNPVYTPNTLDIALPTVITALGNAIKDLEGAHIPLDASPGMIQVVDAHGHRIPIQGGPGDPNGVFNAIYNNFTTGEGYGPIYLGSSFIQVIGWNNGPCPIGASILTYSESDNPASPHYADQTELFSHKQWVPDTFCQAAVLKATKQTLVLQRASH